MLFKNWSKPITKSDCSSSPFITSSQLFSVNVIGMLLCAWQLVFLSTTTLKQYWYVYLMSICLSHNNKARICHDKNYTPGSTRFAKFVQQTSRELDHRYTKMIKTVVNKITRELKPKCTPRDFCPLFAGVLGLGDVVMVDGLCWSDMLSVGWFS